MTDYPSRSLVDGERLLTQFHDLARFGATERGGLDRQTASEADRLARDRLCSIMRERGLEVRVDGIGNIFGLAEWTPGAGFVLVGSHLDSQPHGGRFDGAYGVVAALEAVSSIHAAVNEGVLPVPPINMAVVNWTNEEGARFRPSLTGSSVVAGALGLEDALALTDDAGISMEQALTAIGYRGNDESPPAAAAVEIHVEQGRVLEETGTDVAVATGNWGATKYELVFSGRQAHTGPTPMAERRDALLAASRLIVRAREWADARDDRTLRTSVGRAVIEPNSANVVPAKVTLSLEIRSPDEGVLAAMEGPVRTTLDEIARDTGCDVSMRSVSRRKPLHFWEEGIGRAEAAAADAGYSCARLDTVAGHDVVAMMDHVPGVLLFVPSHQGIGHHEEEFTADRDMVRGCEVLSRLIWDLAREASLDSRADARSQSGERP